MLAIPLAKTYVVKQLPAIVLPALALWGWQFFLHVWQPFSTGDSRLWLPHAVAWLHDAIVLFCAALIASRFERRGWGVLALAGAVLAIYPQVLRQHLVTQTNLFASDAAAARIFLLDYLGLEGLWPMLGAAFFAGCAARHARPLRVSKTFVIVIGIVTIAALLTLPRSPHPLIGSVWQQATASFSGNPRVVPSLQTVAVTGQSSIIKTTPRLLGEVVYQHVFLIVLEGIPASDFERDFLRREDGFYALVQNQAAYYTNYRSTNLDSYTSLIAMLTSRQVPYRAYADPSIYEHINLRDNLTRTLRANGYHSAFLSTYHYQPFVPTRDDWNTVLDRNDLDIGAQWLTLGNTRMEQAVEDKAAIASLVDTAARNERSFTLHELVYGHSPEWLAKTGKTPSVYADEYLIELTKRLTERNLLDDSLIVVVSDHGERARISDPENYRVPLLVIGKCIESGTKSGLYSHLDLTAMIERWLTKQSLPDERNHVDVVGSTERWVYGRLTNSGDYLFIDNERGSIISGSGNIVPLVLQKDFQAKVEGVAVF